MVKVDTHMTFTIGYRNRDDFLYGKQGNRIQRFLIQSNDMVRNKMLSGQALFNGGAKLDSCFADAWNNLGTLYFNQINTTRHWNIMKCRALQTRLHGWVF